MLIVKWHKLNLENNDTNNLLHNTFVCIHAYTYCTYTYLLYLYEDFLPKKFATRLIYDSTTTNTKFLCFI